MRKIERIHGELNKERRLPLEGHIAEKIKIGSNFKKSAFANIVKRAKSYIKDGEVIQVVLSQRFKLPIKKKPLDIYRSLRSLNPSPYMFFLNFKEAVLIGSSPEMHVRCEQGTVEIRPIAGTRPRGKTQDADEKLEAELLADSKEKAEHLMLVDLARNDLGRVCQTGKVKVREFMTVARYSHVMHLVSEVEGALDKRYDLYDILRATFPAGTVSGSPKVRALEIIDELENVERGPYAGCLGYLGFSGNMDTCIIIRTILVKGNTAYIQAGAGIVADSRPGREYQESVNKAKALIEAITK
jgi:anthranilate synthase component 1